MTFLSSIRQTTWSHWCESIISLVYTLAGSLAPVWGGFLMLAIFSRHPGFSDFSQHGEFALYSAAMFAPTAYIIHRDLKVPGFAGRSILGLFCYVGMFIASVFFVAVTTAFMAPTPVLAINQRFLAEGTLLLFLSSCLLTMLVTALNEARLIPDVRESAAQAQAKLDQDFGKLGDNQ